MKKRVNSCCWWTFFTVAVMAQVGVSLAGETLEPRSCSDSGNSPAKCRYVLRWKSLGANRDRARKSPLPAPSLMQLHGDGAPIDVDRVWSGHRVGFCLLTHAEVQYAAYYNADRRMVVAARKLSERRWKRQIISSRLDHAPRTGQNVSSTILGWDSHNYITMIADSDGFIHLSGNMHVNALTYFRQTRLGDITSFEQLPMTGKLETRCTYPKFMFGPKQELIFHYRHGGSGRGDEIYNVYDLKNRSWSRLLESALFSGGGKMNAYAMGPSVGPDGRFHMIWVWRDTPDCSTNHHISYAFSEDMKKWQSASGKAITLPITIDTPDVVIDPSPPDGGLLNASQVFGFDSRNRPVVSYHKYDNAGNSQIYNARFESGGWKIVPGTSWNYRWAFAGGGSIGKEIFFSRVHTGKPGVLTQTFRHSKYGKGTISLNEDSLQPMGK